MEEITPISEETWRARYFALKKKFAQAEKKINKLNQQLSSPDKVGFLKTQISKLDDKRRYLEKKVSKFSITKTEYDELIHVTIPRLKKQNSELENVVKVLKNHYNSCTKDRRQDARIIEDLAEENNQLRRQIKPGTVRDGFKEVIIKSKV